MSLSKWQVYGLLETTTPPPTSIWTCQKSQEKSRVSLSHFSCSRLKTTLKTKKREVNNVYHAAKNNIVKHSLVKHSLCCVCKPSTVSYKGLMLKDSKSSRKSNGYWLTIFAQKCLCLRMCTEVWAVCTWAFEVQMYPNFYSSEWKL